MSRPLPTYFRPSNDILVISQTQEEQYWSCSGGAFYRRFAQTFTAPSSGNVTKIKLKMQRSTVNPTGTFTAEIFPTSAGAPNITTPLGTATLDITTIPVGEYTEMTLTFSTPVAVTNSTVYAIVFSYPTINDSVDLKETYVYEVGGGYTGGAIWYEDSGWSEWEEDFYFKLYMAA